MPAPVFNTELSTLALTKDPMDLAGEADYSLDLTEDNGDEGILEAGIALGDRLAELRTYLKPNEPVSIFVVSVDDDQTKHYFVGLLEQVRVRIRDLNDLPAKKASAVPHEHALNQARLKLSFALGGIQTCFGELTPSHQKTLYQVGTLLEEANKLLETK